MKLFGPTSWSTVLRILFKVVNYIVLLFGVVLLVHFLFAWFDYLGWVNPLAALTVTEDYFDLRYHLLNDSPLTLPVGGTGGVLGYMAMSLFGVATYYCLTRFLGNIFHSLSQPTIFVQPLVRNTRLLGWLLIVIALLNGFTAFYAPLSDMSVYSETIFFFFTGIMLWFLSKVFEEGNRLQQELDLTI